MRSNSRMEKCLLITWSADKSLCEAARAAFQVAAPSGRTVAAASREGCLEARRGCGAAVLVLGSDQRDELAWAAGARDPIGLSAWRPVVRGAPEDLAGVTFVPESGWTPSLLAPLVRLALELNRAERRSAEFQGDLLSIGTRIVHDMRTPIGGIMVGCEAINEQLADEGRSTKPIVESGDDLLRIVKRLAVLTGSFAREPRLGVIAPDLAVMNAVQRIEREAARMGVVISYPAEFPKVVADPSLLESALSVYLENCLKHAGKDRRIVLDCRGSDEQVVFSVSDDGPGVDARSKDILFRPFFRMHEPNAPRGMGLPIVEAIARMLGGSCGYAALAPRGSAFWLSVPAARPARIP